MNLNFPRDEHLHKDKHLQKALQHAPDSEIAPSEVTRQSVLDYADKALKIGHEIRRESWFARIKKAFHAWKIPSSQLTGVGSLAASLLVVVMIWHENPDDPMQVATAPEAASSAESRFDASPEESPEAKLARNELTKDEAAKDDVNLAEQSPQVAAESTPAVASADNAANSAAPNVASPELQEKNQDKLKAKVVSNTKPAKQEIETTPQAAPMAAPADRTVLARTPEAVARQRLEKDADSTSAKEAVVTAEVAPPAPVAAAPAPIAESAPAIANAKASADAASGQAAARAAPINKAENQAENQMTEAQQAQPEAKADLPNATSANPAVPTNNSALVLALSKQGGQTLALKDIQAGRLRVLYISNAATSVAVDETTGYRKEAVFTSEEISLESLSSKVEAYNQTMREWHLSHQ